LSEHGRPPSDAAELGAGEKALYPDGGYYVLEPEGRIRIRFTVKRELKNRSIVLMPKFDEGDVNWACAADSGILQRYLPASCRE
jgi:hypothetical protein